jgi:hypothetical protein
LAHTIYSHDIHALAILKEDAAFTTTAAAMAVDLSLVRDGRHSHHFAVKHFDGSGHALEF